MSNNTNTNTTREQLAAVMPRDASYAFINGIRFDNMDTAATVDALRLFYPDMYVRARFTDSATLFTVVESAPLAPVAAAVAADMLQRIESSPRVTCDPRVGVPSRVEIDKRDARTLYRMPADTVAARYGMQRTNQRVMFSIGNDNDATRVLYRHIATGAPFAIYRGAFVAMRESDVLPAPAPVRTARTAPQPKPARAPKPARKYTHVCFTQNGRAIVRKLYSDGTIQQDGARVDVSTLANVTRHTCKETAQKRAAAENKTARKTAKLTQDASAERAQTRRNRNGFEHIPDKYKSIAITRALNAHETPAACDSVAAWYEVKRALDEMAFNGIGAGSVVIDGVLAWIYPKANLRFTKQWQTVIEPDETRGYCNKKQYGTWFVKLAQ